VVYETEVKDGVLRMSALGGVFGAAIEDSDVVMARIVDRLVTDRNVVSVIITETRDHEYDEAQTKLLVGMADAIGEIVRERRIVSMGNMGDPAKCSKWQTEWYNWLSTLVTFQMRGDPIGAYLNLVREIRRLEIIQGKGDEQERECIQYYMEHALFPVREILENTELVRMAQPLLTGYHAGDRSIYRKLFHPMTRPSFMLTKFSTRPPPGEVVKRYQVGAMTVEIFKIPGQIRPVYFVTPPEFRLSEEEYTLLDDARKTLEQRRPVELEMKEQSKMRDLFLNISRELLRDIADVRGFKLSPEDIEKLATILTRYTAGLGIIELLLADEKIEDVNINSPLGTAPIYIRHSEFEECETNLMPTTMDGERLATRFKLLSGRPLDEANPVLDTEITVPGGIARVAAIGPRLSPEGLAFALRRHRFRPWTFPLFINERMFSPMFAGLMWFVASYGRTLLIAGTRGAGKTSVLGSLALQTLPFYRMITVEDTFELPIEALRTLGFNVERMKSRSVITKVELELPAEEAIRTALRMGDSTLIIGEVRSVEAKALYEAMRIGALANVVAGTIHGESAYGVFDRVVNDLGVPATSFKATDLVIIANRLRTADGLKSFRRITGLTEVRKNWSTDPASEKGFVDLMQYESKGDSLMPTDTLLNGESFVLNEIAKRVPGWAGRWDAVWDNIQLRSKILETIVQIANQTGHKDLMEAETTVASNQKFHELAEKSRIEVGEVDSKRVYEGWLAWFKERAKGAS
jgi:type IV secretory pathway ATPase VirB11/archaellum biosynthesis ATPase